VGNLQKVKDRIAGGGVALGVFVTISDSCVSEMVGYAGYDFVWIDAEHAPLDRREIFLHIVAAQGAGAAAFVRVPGVDPHTIKAILDMGPDGVIFPFIDSAEKAELAVRSCLYPPRGMRGQGPVRAIRYGIDNEGEYIGRSGSLVWKILQIENEEGYKHVDEILAVPGIDSMFVGPADLGRSVDHLPEPQKSARVNEMVEDMARKFKAKKIISGTATGSTPEAVGKCVARGFGWLAVSQDARLISGPLVENLKKIRSQYK
jgi:2-keto-3-deoxy-L-rhamnonate aldolase RhmA